MTATEDGLMNLGVNQHPHRLV